MCYNLFLKNGAKRSHAMQQGSYDWFIGRGRRRDKKGDRERGTEGGRDGEQRERGVGDKGDGRERDRDRETGSRQGPPFIRE